MNEEQVTKNILFWLESIGWNILCFDFPQSGTGYPIHPNKRFNKTKNKGIIIPDIVAFKDSNVIFFENKDRFVLSDFIKIEKIKNNSEYSDGIDKLLLNIDWLNISFGVGMPFTKNNTIKSNLNKNKVDFVIFVNDKNECMAFYQQTILF